MEQYYEQSVAGKRDLRSSMLYCLCWLLTGIFVIAAMFFAADITGSDPSVFTINWVSVIGVVLCLLFAGVLFLRKDHLRMEYDYIYSEGVLRIFGVMNRRRRKEFGQIDIRRVQSFRPASRMQEAYPGMHRHNWYVQECRYYIIYREENVRHIALLEMDDELAVMIRRQLPVGAWQNAEGKN